MIDRKATRYRLNQYGSQFDNKGALDIQKKQELDRRGEVMKGADEREDDPVVEVESNAEDAYGYDEFKKRASELTPAYLASRPEDMKKVMDKLKGLRKIKDSVYKEFTELYNALINSDGDFIKKEHRLKLVRFYNDKVYYSVFHPRPKEKEDSPTVMDVSFKEIPAEV